MPRGPLFPSGAPRGGVEGFAGRADEHFEDEERSVVPLIAEYLSPKEWRKFLARGSAF